LQRIRHYGFLASCHRREKPARIRERLANPTTELLPDTAALAAQTASAQPSGLRQCPVCGEHAMRLLPGIPRSWEAKLTPCAEVCLTATAMDAIQKTG
jgi:hypothetical protein